MPKRIYETSETNTDNNNNDDSLIIDNLDSLDATIIDEVVPVNIVNNNAYTELEKTEEKQVISAISEFTTDGEMNKVADFFEQLDVFIPPSNEYDVVIYKLRENTRYSVGTAASRALVALKQNGLFVVDYSGYATNLAEIKLISEFCGLIYKDQDNKNGIIVFRKPMAGEKREIVVDMVENE